MTDILKSYLKKEFDKRNLNVNLRKCTEADLFYYILLFKEGIDLPIYMVEIFMKYARNILDVKNIKARIRELKDGEINLDDFMSGKDMAEYLEEGVEI